MKCQKCKKTIKKQAWKIEQKGLWNPEELIICNECFQKIKQKQEFGKGHKIKQKI